jgi:predicted transcriptional regulator
MKNSGPANLSNGDRPFASVVVPLAASTPISAVLSHGGVHVGADTSLEALTAMMSQRGLSSAAVINESGAVVGVISAADLAALANSQNFSDCTAHEVMHGPSTMLSESASLATAAALMAVERASELPIACSHCESICVLSALDILGWLGQQHSDDAPHAREAHHELIGG